MAEMIFTVDLSMESKMDGSLSENARFLLTDVAESQKLYLKWTSVSGEQPKNVRIPLVEIIDLSG